MFQSQNKIDVLKIKVKNRTMPDKNFILRNKKIICYIGKVFLVNQGAPSESDLSIP